jgi:hypothetical protein
MSERIASALIDPGTVGRARSRQRYRCRFATLFFG